MRPTYYHQAGATGIGFDHTGKGSDAVNQYHELLISRRSNPATYPEEFLLWFHHLPWNYRMKSRRSLWDEMCYRYDKGVKQVRVFQQIWDKAAAYVDSVRFREVQQTLQSESVNDELWKDADLQYFQ